MTSLADMSASPSLVGGDVAGVPQASVVLDAGRIRPDAVCVEQLVLPSRRRSSTTATAWRWRGRPTGSRRRGRRDRRARNTGRRRRSTCSARTRRRGRQRDRRRMESVTQAGGPNGHASTGRPSCSIRRPLPIARAAVRGSRTHRGSTADRPASPAVCSQPAPAPSTSGTRIWAAAQRSRSASATK